MHYLTPILIICSVIFVATFSMWWQIHRDKKKEEACRLENEISRARTEREADTHISYLLAKLEDKTLNVDVRYGVLTSLLDFYGRVGGVGYTARRLTSQELDRIEGAVRSEEALAKSPSIIGRINENRLCLVRMMEA